MNWYYVEAGQQRGPISEAELSSLANSGSIQPDTLVWREGMMNWQPYREVTAGPSPMPVATAGIVCSECGKAFSPDEVVRIGNGWACASCKPIAVQRLQEGVILPGGLAYGGFWIRFAAKLIDWIIVGLVIFAFTFGLFPLLFGTSEAEPEFRAVMTTQLLVQLFSQVIWGIYTIFFLGKYGATPGKMVCKLVVVTPEGGKITYARATGRFFAEILSGIICNIGYLMAAFDDEKKTLHDRICNTRVVKQ